MISGGIYVHIPFCASKCSYCNFFSRVAKNEIKQKYLSALIEQIRAGRRTDFLVKSIYIGGGTPSVMGGAAIKQIAEAIREAFPNIDENCEFTVEVNPESVTASFIQDVVFAGVNRISMGVQSFVDSELEMLGRHANAEMCKASYETIVKNGIDNISIDLMLAVPRQTTESLQFSLENAASLNPRHISAYLLKVEKNTVFDKRGVLEKDEDLQAKMYMQASDFLTQNGYEHYEVSNFSQKGYRSVHNSSYWTLTPYIAFGAGAHGFEGNERYYYKESVCGKFERVTEEILTADDFEQERIMLLLRTTDGSVVSPSKESYMQSLVLQGFAVKKGEKYALTPKGFLVSNTIIANIL